MKTSILGSVFRTGPSCKTSWKALTACHHVIHSHVLKQCKRSKSSDFFNSSAAKKQWIPSVLLNPSLKQCILVVLGLHNSLHGWRKTPVDHHHPSRLAVDRRRGACGTEDSINPWITFVTLIYMLSWYICQVRIGPALDRLGIWWICAIRGICVRQQWIIKIQVIGAGTQKTW